MAPIFSRKFQSQILAIKNTLLRIAYGTITLYGITFQKILAIYMKSIYS